MFDVKSVRETFALIETHFSNYPMEKETVPLDQCLGRILSRDIAAREDMPAFHRSSVDGYAVTSKDTFGVSESMPAQLRLVGEVKMGEKPDFVIRSGESAYVPTGGELPQGADGVVMMEYSEDFGDGDIFLNKSVAPGNNVIFRGDDVAVDQVVLQKGRRIRPQDLAMLAGLGLAVVPVQKKLKIGIISTGDEVVGVEETPIGAQVRDMNSYGVLALSQGLGLEAALYGIVKDDFDRIDATVRKAVEENDVVAISGGSSVGTKDVTVKVIDGLGAPGLLLHGIAVKPGKPTILGKVGEKAVMGLPGHPASAFVIFQIFGKHLIRTMEGQKEGFAPFVEAVLGVNYPSNHGREEYLSVSLQKNGEETLAMPVFGKSGMISLMTKADGYVHIKRESEGLNKGQTVQVTLF
ncbi:molybdopterin molybdotransferase MoeA [Alkalibacter rhizosphaerae]|uniref:Molybdopterin molybdenumtransferase n=1 Tax=Alkalibacter rhizosphaerae TaxID=2815577 RepID=A0A975AH97_9FIRM|nr:gephyrin-like molybdotransferase Glp [Alkalibacter rhizosphaerae]QSX07778.1 molybdopterin molybdotransferase MoeA [Alkalibacter rhizosphaerae]